MLDTRQTKKELRKEIAEATKQRELAEERETAAREALAAIDMLDATKKGKKPTRSASGKRGGAKGVSADGKPKRKPRKGKAAKMVKPAGGEGAGGRPRLSGHRQQDVVEGLEKRPGLTTLELAELIDVKPNYLYRMLPRMQKEGILDRDDNQRWKVVLK